MDKSKLSIIIVMIGVYVVSTAASYLFFSKNTLNSLQPKQSVNSPVSSKTKNGEAMTFDDTLPKTEACPLNGTLYSKNQRKWWEQHRPLGVMIENHENARPQSGLSGTDVVYEAVAEGGITRFLAIYYCQDAGQLGPVRSARTYFLDFISEYGNSPLYAHVGGANTPGPADALGQITQYGWTGHNDLNQFSIGFPTFWRDYERLGHNTETEHTMYSTTSKLWDFAAKSRKLTNVDEDGVLWNEKFVSYTFVDDVSVSARPENQTIKLEFWKGYGKYVVEWIYDKALNSYKRNNGGEAHIDRNTNKQITTKNIAVLYVVESNANDGYDNNLHLLYKNKGTGKAVVFINGKQINGTWKKDSRTARTLLYDASGTPIKFTRGRIWFEILPTDGVLEVK